MRDEAGVELYEFVCTHLELSLQMRLALLNSLDHLLCPVCAHACSSKSEVKQTLDNHCHVI